MSTDARDPAGPPAPRPLPEHIRRALQDPPVARRSPRTALWAALGTLVAAGLGLAALLVFSTSLPL